MRNVPSFITLAACFCLLGMQMSGLHTHVNEHGYTGTPQVTHFHGHSNYTSDTVGHVKSGVVEGRKHLDGHEHTGDKDVSAFDLGLGTSKLSDILVLFGFSLFITTISIYRYSNNYSKLHHDRHREHRWPQLRAPPHFSQILSH